MLLLLLFMLTGFMEFLLSMFDLVIVFRQRSGYFRF